MSKWKECVIDASMGCVDGLFTFCPIEGDIDGDYSIVTGMNFVSSKAPEKLKLVAIIHPDGQIAVDAFCGQFEHELEALRTRMGEG